MKGFIAVIAAVVMFAIANTAAAEVRLDPEAGTGFVGKGDVQDVFAWNNAELQENAPFVGFLFSGSAYYRVTCTASAASETYVMDAQRNGELVVEPRRNHQGKVTGFDLVGFMSLYEAEPPEVGDACRGMATTVVGTLTSVTSAGDSAYMLVSAPNLGAPVIWSRP